jgi:hypothetical protein
LSRSAPLRSPTVFSSASPAGRSTGGLGGALTAVVIGGTVLLLAVAALVFVVVRRRARTISYEVEYEDDTVVVSVTSLPSRTGGLADIGTFVQPLDGEALFLSASGEEEEGAAEAP